MTANTNEVAVLAFPNICAAIGGAQYVRYSARFAWIKLPGVEKEVRVSRSKLPTVDKWTSFNLADAAR